MGILPLQYESGQNAESLGLTGKELFSIEISEDFKVGQTVQVTTNTGIKFFTKARIDTEPEIEYYRDGGILIYVLKKLMK